MFPHGLTFCRWRGGTTGVGYGRPRSHGVDRVDSSPRDQWFKHVRHFWVKWRWLNAADADTWKLLERWIFIKQTPMVAKPDRAIEPPTLPNQIRRPRSLSSWRRMDSSRTSDLHQVAISIGRPGRFAEELHDRGPIEPRSWIFHHGIISTIIRRHPVENKYHDRGLIAAQSWLDRGAILARSWAFSKPNSSLFAADLKPQKHAIETASTTLENRPHERVNCPWSSGQFPSLKACISLLCSSTFDRLVKKLSEFRGRS